MMTVIPTPRYLAALDQLDSRKAKAARNALKKFVVNPFARGLSFKQLQGSENYTIRATKGFRICLRRVAPQKYEIVDVGNHDYIINKYD